MSLPNKLLSIDIGSERIKIIQTLKKGKKIVVLNSVIISTPDNAIRDGVINNQDDLAKVIHEALLSHKFKEKNVVFTVSSSKIITRDVELPYMSPKKLSNMIRLNAEEYFPVNLSEYCLDYTISDVVESEGGKKAKVIVFAALTTLISGYTALADTLKLNVLSLDYAGNSMVTYIRHEGIQGTNLFLNIGAESTMVTIMTGSVVKFSRNLLFGTHTINESIRNHFEVDYEEATKISKERQLLSFEKQEKTYLTNDVTSGMEQILSGVSRLVDYYTSRNKSQVEKVYILGGGSQINSVNDYISRYFGLEVISFNKLEKVIIKGKSQDNSNLVYLASAIGASLSTINLLPASIKNREKDNARKRLPYLLIVLVIVALAAFTYMKYEELNEIKNKKTATQTEINSMSDINGIIASFNELEKKKAFRTNLYELSSTTSDNVLDFIKGLEKTMPDEVFLTSLVDDGTSIQMEVTAQNEGSVAKMLTYLKNIKGLEVDGIITPLFSSVTIPDVTRYGNSELEASYVNVAISCVYSTSVEGEE